MEISQGEWLITAVCESFGKMAWWRPCPVCWKWWCVKVAQMSDGCLLSLAGWRVLRTSSKWDLVLFFQYTIQFHLHYLHKLTLSSCRKKTPFMLNLKKQTTFQWLLHISGHVNHPLHVENMKCDTAAAQWTRWKKANVVWRSLRQPGDWLWFFCPISPCRVTLTQSILDIKIRQATGAWATECHIP